MELKVLDGLPFVVSLFGHGNMNEALRRFAELAITPEKYDRKDLHKIKNCLCFIRDSENAYEVSNAEKFLAEFIRRKENDIPFDVVLLELEYGIKN